MAGLGAKVTAIDFSEEFIKISRSKPLGDKIDYRVIDVTKKNALNKLKGNLFNSVVCTMAIMDIEDINPLVGFLPLVLKNGGLFVFSILHPCFNSGETVHIHEHTDFDFGGKVHNAYYVKTSDYLISRKIKGIGMLGQPEPQYYFHRPLSEILEICFANRFCLNGIREPSFKDTVSDKLYDKVFKNIPPAIIFRFKLMK